jgi:hypothetical protein
VPRDDKPTNRYSHYYNVIARIKKGSSPAEVKHDLEVAGAVVATHYPEPNSRWKPRAIPVKDEIVGTAQSTLGVLASAGVAMLLLACVNVAGLLLGRAHARTREMGVRAAIGATRATLTRQLLVESLVLTAGGAALGVALAYAANGRWRGSDRRTCRGCRGSRWTRRSSRSRRRRRSDARSWSASPPR